MFDEIILFFIVLNAWILLKAGYRMHCKVPQASD